MPDELAAAESANDDAWTVFAWLSVVNRAAMGQSA